MYQHILLPVALDHETAFTDSIEIARRLCADGGKLTLLHVIETVPGYVAAQMPAGALEDAQSATTRQVEDMARGAGADVGWAVISGSPGSAIVEYAEQNKADCIVMASHKPGLTDYFLGSTAARVVRHAPCSVHVIR
ncbi:MAG: universal stress protein [Pseudomonadota bacterium]